MSQKDIDSGTMTPGTVVFWKDFPYPDGENSNKLLLIVSFPFNQAHLFFKTTSQDKGIRPRKPGCHDDLGLHFFQAHHPWFKVDTWILIDDPLEMGINEFHDAFRKNEAHILERLEKEHAAAVINCFRKSDNCSKHHLRYLAD